MEAEIRGRSTLCLVIDHDCDGLVEFIAVFEFEAPFLVGPYRRQ